MAVLPIVPNSEGEPPPRGTATDPGPPLPLRRPPSLHDGRSGASRRITRSPPQGLAPVLPAPIELPSDEGALELPELLLDEPELPDPVSPPRGAAEPTVDPVFGREPCCGAAQACPTPIASAVVTAPIVNA